MTESRTCSPKLEFEFEDEIKAEDLEVRKNSIILNDYSILINIYLSIFFQSVNCDEFLDQLLQTDATLDEGTVPDIKVMDNDINMMSGEVNASSLLDFFSQLTSKNSSSISSMPIKDIKEEPLTEEDLKALQKDRQKKDNHNLSKCEDKNSKAFYKRFNFQLRGDGDTI